MFMPKVSPAARQKCFSGGCTLPESGGTSVSALTCRHVSGNATESACAPMRIHTPNQATRSNRKTRFINIFS